MKNQHKKGLWKDLLCGALGLALLSVLYVKLDSPYLKPKDFEKAKWIEFYNPNGRIWDCYMDEDIPKHQFNWHYYLDEVKKRNNNRLEGRILLPDLDGDGRVGK